MSAKKKIARKRPSPKTPPPATIRLKEFLQNFHDTHEYAPDRSFCFVLGSGASLTAGIPTGASLVDRWLVEMHDTDDQCSKRILPPHATIETYADSLLEGEKERLKKWSENKFSDILTFTFEDRAAHYGRIYKARFQSDPGLGQLFLRKLIHRRPPSIGFHLLARILNRTRHRIAITTNFDHLVEDAIAITENEAVQSYNHERLASFLRSHLDQPAIAKIHGDILLRTFNAEDELEALNEPWTTALQALFQTHTPIIIGYGGNDPGFMDFLIQEMKTWPADRRCYWFVRKAENFAKVRKFLELTTVPALRLVVCPGFTELMVLLDEILNFKPLDEELRQRAEEVATGLTSATAKARGEVEDHQRKLREASMMSESSTLGGESASATAGTLPPPESRTWQEWRGAINSCASTEIEEKVTQEALHALPDSLPLKALTAAYALREQPSDRSHLRKIEQFLQQSESHSGPDSEETLSVMNSLALAWDVLGDYHQAEAFYRRVIAERERVLGPGHPDTLMSRNNLAATLSDQGKHAAAEQEHLAVLAIRERVLGPDHPDVFQSCYNLSFTLENLGRKTEALEHARRAFAGWNKALGEEHPRTKLAKAFLEQP